VPRQAMLGWRVHPLRVGVCFPWRIAERVFVRELQPEAGRKLLSIVRRGSGSVVRWRRSQIVVWSAQRMAVAQIAEIAFTSEDRVREVIHNFNADGFDSLAPKYAGGRPPTFTLPQRQQIKKIVLSRPTDHRLPFSTWSLSKLAEFLVAEGVVDNISHEVCGFCSVRRACPFK
jgi:transposase